MAQAEAHAESAPNLAVDTAASDSAAAVLSSSGADDPLSQYTGMKVGSTPTAAPLSLAKVGATQVDQNTDAQAAQFAMTVDWGSFLQKNQAATPRLVTVRLHKSV